MIRQRLRLRRSPLRFVGRALVLLLAAALIWYGLMLLLGGLGVAPRTLNGLSGYRSAFDFLAGLTPSDLSGEVQAIAAVAGSLVFAVFAYLAYKEVPRPALARHKLELPDSERGRVAIEPRALERIAETVALGHAAVSDASGRWGDEELTVELALRRTSALAATLRQVQERVLEALGEHGLPERRVAVTLSGFDRSNKRELS